MAMIMQKVKDVLHKHNEGGHEMSKNMVVEDVRKKMDDLKKKRAAAIEEIEAKKREAEKDLVAAQAEMAEAASVTDVDAYAAADERKRKAEIALNMFSARLNQIMKQELISGQESDQILSSLQNHIRGLEAGLTNDARDAIDQIIALIDKYYGDVEATMRVYRAWTLGIREVESIPYISADYKGCALAGQLNVSVRALRGSIDAKQNKLRQQSEYLKALGQVMDNH